jgi:hypothetical protein
LFDSRLRLTVLLPLLHLCLKPPPRGSRALKVSKTVERSEVGAVGSIELMVAMAVTAIATFNLKRVTEIYFSLLFTI